jgi:hypothetical protein
MNRSQERKTPFRRVNAEEVSVSQKFADNSFEAKVSLAVWFWSSRFGLIDKHATNRQVV